MRAHRQISALAVLRLAVFVLVGMVVMPGSAAAQVAVGTLLGSPPPEMGTQSTTFLWQGMARLPGHPRVWRFAFGPTQIPGAPTVRIYVTPLGRVVETEPADLEARLKALHPY